MNDWVREALEHSGISQKDLSEILTRRGLGAYSRSTINKMTTRRAIRMDEAAAIAEVTGYPIPASEALSPQMDPMVWVTPKQKTLLGAHEAHLERFARLPQAQRRLIEEMITEFLEQGPGASLGPHFSSLISRQVATGRYGSEDDVLRAGLRLLEEHDARLPSLQEPGERREPG